MSWSTLFQALKMIRPPKADAPNKVVLRWRWTVSAMLVVSMVFMVWALGGVPKIQGLAFASDLQEVEAKIDVKIQQALVPVNEKLEASDKYLKRLVSKDIRADIFEKLTSYCAATAGTKARLREELDTLQDEYEEATGNRYPEPRCEDV